MKEETYMDLAIMVFVRNPIFGKVKSRLAATIGKDKALDIYKLLLAHTEKICKDIPVSKFIFYEDFINWDDIWNNEIYEKMLQEGDDLGERMKNAFKNLFDRGFKEIIIIGSDCYDLIGNIIFEAFNILSKKNVVIGPALDGGYYLLGMNNFMPELFDNKKWSSNTVYRDTIEQLNTLNYSYHSLVLLSDIDLEEDIKFITDKVTRRI